MIYASAPSKISTLDQVQIDAATSAIKEALASLGVDIDDENFASTPQRFIKYLLEYLQPFDLDEVLKVDFSNEHSDAGYKGMVVQSDIPFRTICPHHLLPVLGKCHIGYIPTNRVVGLSKLTRVVQAVGHELPRMQETCTDILADMLHSRLEAKGVIVVITAHHNCMQGRGVKVENVPTTTSTVRGLFRDVPACREEFFRLIGLAHNLTR